MRILILSILLALSSTGLCQDGLKLSKSDIKLLIEQEAIAQGLDPDLVTAIAMVESGLNPNARGTKGEIGLFQIMPNISSQLGQKNVKKHIQEAVNLLKYWKRSCPLQEGNTFIICYNNGFRKPKYPLLHPYYKKVIKAMHAGR